MTASRSRLLTAVLVIVAAPRVSLAQLAPAPEPTPAPEPAAPEPTPPPSTPPQDPAPVPPAMGTAVASPTPAAPSGDAESVVTAKIKATLYGFVEANFVWNSTQSCLDYCSNFQIQKPGTYKGDHGRTVFSTRDSRFGVRLAAPEYSGIRTSGMLEADFFGPTSTSEQATWVNPVLRIRHAYLKLETPVVDVLIGQTWNLFGWQASYLVASVQEPGLPGQMFQRTPQLRVTKALKTDDVTVELAAAANRPPQMDSGIPELVAGVRLLFERWTGRHTLYMTSSAIQPASLAVSGDARRFRIAELSPAPRVAQARAGGGIAVDAYLPIVPASKDSSDHALSIIAELAIGSGTSDMYTALGAAGTSNAAPPPAMTGAPPPTYTPNFDPGLAAYGADGRLELIKWKSYMVGVEYYPPLLSGRVGTFANYGHMQSPNARNFGGPMVMDTALGKTRDSESFYDAGMFVEPTKATRIGADAAIYSDHYVDGTRAINRSLMTSVFLFF